MCLCVWKVYGSINQAATRNQPASQPTKETITFRLCLFEFRLCFHTQSKRGRSEVLRSGFTSHFNSLSLVLYLYCCCLFRLTVIIVIIIIISQKAAVFSENSFSLTEFYHSYYLSVIINLAFTRTKQPFARSRFEEKAAYMVYVRAQNKKMFII